MNKKQFKEFFKKLRLIAGAETVGQNGYLYDLAKSFNVSIDFCRIICDLRKPIKAITKNKYSKTYQYNLARCDYWEALNEKRVGA